MNPFITAGIIISVLGALVIAAVLISARTASKRRQQQFGSEDPVIPVNLASVNNGVVVANVGGQVIFANEIARKWFTLDGGDPDLWLLAQRVTPPDSFLELFATEGHAAFQIDDRSVEATSHRVAVGDTSQYIVVIREETPMPVLDREERGSPKALQVISEVSRTINATLRLEPTVEATLEGVQRLVDFEAAQLCLWDSESELLRPAGRSGPEAYVAATLDEDQIYRRDEGYPGWIVRKRQSLLITGTDKDFSTGSLTVDRPSHAARRDEPAIESFLGVPLTVRNRLVGTLELSATRPDYFDRSDLAILELLAEQVANAIDNAQQYSQQAERVTELSGLQKIAAAISVLQDPRQLFSQLGQRVAELTGTEMAGVLLYDRETDRLVAQRPLYGVVDAVAARYAIPLKRGTPARSLWEDVSYWYSNNVSEDHLIAELGMLELVEMTGVKMTAMASMTVGDERIGVLQVSNKTNGAPFTLEDIRLLQTYADQAAIVVESARLYGQEQSRVAELQGLQQIVQAMGSFTNPEELYSQLTQRIAELLGVDICGVLIFEPDDEALVARTPFFGVPDEVTVDYVIPVGKRGTAREIWREHELFESNSVFTDERIDSMGLREIARAMSLQTVLLAPLSAGGRRFGMLQVSNKTEGTDFDDDDKRLMTIFAGQAAALIDNARLYADTDATLRKRAAELRSVSRISRELNATLELERILEVIAAEAQRAEGATWGNVVMFDWSADGTEIMPSRTFGTVLGKEARVLEKAAARSKEPLVINDFSKVAHYPSPIEGARSALLVPIQFEERAVGVIGLYGDKPNALGESAAEFVQALSSQATIAVTNATRHQEQVERSELLASRAEQMSQIFELGRAFRSDQSLEGNLTSVARAVAESAGFDLTLISILDEKKEHLIHSANSGLSDPDFTRIKKNRPGWQVIESYLDDEKYRLGGAYFVPHDEGIELIDTLGLPEWPDEFPDVGFLQPDRWHPGDVLMVRLRSSGGETLGLMTVDQPRNGLVPDRNAIELMSIFGNQAAVVIENSRLYRSVEERAEELGKSLENLEKSYTELDKLSQEMIRKDVELSQANELLNLRAGRLLALHRIMESVDTTRQPDEVLQSIASQLVEEMDIDQCFVAVAEEEGVKSLRLAAKAGRLPDKLDYRKLLASHEIIAGVFGGEAPVIYAPGGKRGTPAADLAESLESHTLAILPMHFDPHGGIIMLGSTRSAAGFGDDERDLFSLLASQIAVEYENARLYGAVQEEASSAAADRDRLQQLHLITTALQQTRDLHERLAIIARGLRSVGWSKTVVTLLDSQHKTIDMATAGYSEQEEANLEERLLPGSIWASRFDDPVFMSLRLGACYYLPHDNKWVIEHVPGIKESDTGELDDPDAWHPDDQIYLPMYAGTEVIGVVNLREPTTGRKPDVSNLRPIELFVQQASSALENTRLYQETLELQAYNEAVVQSIQQGIVVLGADGTVESANAYVRNQYGWSEDIVGKKLFDAQPALADLGLKDDLAAVVKEGTPIERTNLQLPVADEAHSLNLYLYPRRDEAHTATGAVLLMEDITQRARLEADIALRGQQLAALSEVSRSITSTLSAADVVNNALGQAAQVMSFDHMEIWLRSQEDVSQLELAGARGLKDDAKNIGLKAEMSSVPLFEQIARDNMPLVLGDRPDTERDERPGAGLDHLRSWLGVPMVSGGILTGIMVFEKTEAHAYAPADAQVAAAFGNQVAVALENARLFEEAADRAAELHSRTQRLQLLNRISSTLGGSLDRTGILQTAADELVRAMVVPLGRVFLFDEHGEVARLDVKSPSNPDGSVDAVSFPLKDDLVVQTLREKKEPLAVGNIESDKRVVSIRQQLAHGNVKASLLVPLVVGNVLIGIISIDDDEPREWEEEQIELAQTITNQAAISVQNAQLFQETVTRQRDLSILFEAGQLMASSLDLDTVIENAATYFVQSLNAGGVTVSLYDTRRDVILPMVEYTQMGGIERLEGAPLKPADYPTLFAALGTREPGIIEASNNTLTRTEASRMGSRAITSQMTLPMVARDEVIGVIEIWQRDSARRFGAREIRLGRALAAAVATAMENARLHDETEQRLSELATINEMSRALTQIISIEDLFQMLQSQLSRVVNTHSVTIAQIDSRTGQLIFPLAVRDGKRVDLAPLASDGKDLYSYVIHNLEPVIIPADVPQRLAEKGLRHIQEGLKSFLAVPLISGEVTGLLSVEDYTRENAFSEATLRVLSPIAAQVAVSIENARLYGELEQRLSETTTLQEVSRVVNSALDLQEIFERVVNELADAFEYPLIALFTTEGGELTLQAQHGMTEEEASRVKRLSVEAGISGRAVLESEAQMVEKVGKDPDYLPLKDWVDSEIAVPIISDEEVLGVLSVSAGADNPLGRNDLTLMKTFAGQVAAAMANARLFAEMVRLSEELEQRVEERTRELREERDRIDTLYRIAVELTASLDLDMVLNRALELVGEAVGADTGVLFLIDPQSDLLIHRASMAYDEQLPPGGRQVQLGRHEGLAGWVMDNRQSLVIDNVQVDPRWENVPGTEQRRSLLGAPLIANDEVLGCIFFNSNTEAAFSEEHLKLVEAAANQVAASINNAELYRLIRDQAERLGVMLRSQQTEAAKSQAILESVADGVMVSDQSGEIILFNAAAERVLDLRRDQVLGRPATELSGLYGPGAADWSDTFDQWAENPRDYAGQFLSEQIELDERIVQVHVSPVLHGNEYLGLVSVFRDITREVMADRIKSEFVARVSHELRTPMTSIKGYADLLLLGAAGEVTPEQRRFLETVKSNADRLSLLVNDLLDISRIEQGQIELDVRDIDLRELVHDIMATFVGRREEEQRSIDLRVDFPDSVPTVQADYDRITQVLTNLISNAYSYTADDGYVLLRVSPNADGVQIDVEDNGIGIPKEDQSRVFERFFRGENHPVVFKTAGTGLGLSIVQQLVHMHNGDIWFVSEPGHGSTFSVFLPYMFEGSPDVYPPPLPPGVSS